MTREQVEQLDAECAELAQLLDERHDIEAQIAEREANILRIVGAKLTRPEVTPIGEAVVRLAEAALTSRIRHQN